MNIVQQSHEILTETGMMRTSVYRPDQAGQFPSLIFYSEIFQETAPISRAAAMMAGHGFVVFVPEIFHELNPIGTVLAYDEAGKDKGNQDKFNKPLENHDTDTQALINFAREQVYCTANIGAMGVCIGGHLAFRAALNPDISGAFCLYPTDIHSNTLPCLPNNDSLTRIADIRCELVMVFGKQDPHVPPQGRKLIYQHLEQAQSQFSWLEVNAQHAFMRDEGERFDPALAVQMYLQAVSFFQRTLK
ncbi:dienelactone hydrolase family protein [Shewanella intestini]|uniref:Dienelactone hydrolase family protein n=1 Tax=Shewanella intestini TaxID=2017544 RepID=A0ABS5I2W5_9GAMM|nr:MULTISPECIES: dienelactone hydrolase family protein [Shewanella]MBR9728356.1 dienelactone hydrolase family protein [Shewanella intestini]MRG36698.1 dienelactone hydrolase family protein [Shewanella sp. XMDDZSB0408]